MNLKKTDENILLLINELKTMPEYKMLIKIEHFSFSFDIFEGNFKELIKHLELLKISPFNEDLIKISNRKKAYIYKREANRLLHNYISSSLSLTDHTRNHFRKLFSKNNLIPEYQEEINKRFLNNPLVNFIKDLRQYIQHYQLPILKLNLLNNVETNNFVLNLSLLKEDLNCFSGWSSTSKKFLNTQTKNIDLLEIIKNYHYIIQDFHKWFISQQQKINEKAENKIERHKSKMKEIKITNILLDLFISFECQEKFEEKFFKIFNDEEIDIINLTSGANQIEPVMNILSYMKDLNDAEMEEFRHIIIQEISKR